MVKIINIINMVKMIMMMFISNPPPYTMADSCSINLHHVSQSYLTNRFPTELYSMVAAGAKVAHFSVCGEIARDLDIVLCCGW